MGSAVIGLAAFRHVPHVCCGVSMLASWVHASSGSHSAVAVHSHVEATTVGGLMRHRHIAARLRGNAWHHAVLEWGITYSGSGSVIPSWGGSGVRCIHSAIHQSVPELIVNHLGRAVARLNDGVDDGWLGRTRLCAIASIRDIRGIPITCAGHVFLVTILRRMGLFRIGGRIPNRRLQGLMIIATITRIHRRMRERVSTTTSGTASTCPSVGAATGGRDELWMVLLRCGFGCRLPFLVSVALIFMRDGAREFGKLFERGIGIALDVSVFRTRRRLDSLHLHRLQLVSEIGR